MRTTLAAVSAAPSRIGHLGTVLLTVAACGGLAAVAVATPPGPKRRALLDSTVRFLQESQREDGGFAAEGEPSQGTSAWVALALAAAGINPRNQAKPCGTDAYSYLVGHFQGTAEGATTDYERELMVVNASGTNPHDFGGIDLVAAILERARPDGSFPNAVGDEEVGQVNATVFAVLALSPIHDPQVGAVLAGAVEWLISQQNGDGSWSWNGRGTQGEVDMTAVAIEALNAAGPPTDLAKRDAFERARHGGLAYLEGSQLADGGFPAVPALERESNVASTAWAVQAIWSAREDPESWRTGAGGASEEPLDYMESMQQPDGHVRWRRSSDANGIWMTAYVAPAFAGQTLPIPDATYSAASVPPCGGAPAAADGVIAGGGGNGAPLFSRPKPQSRGRTPGGARLVTERKRRARKHGKSRHGENAVQPRGTERAEPSQSSGGETESVTAVGSSTDSSSAGETGRSGSGDEGGSASGPSAASGVRRLPVTAAEPTGRGATPAGRREVSGVVIGSASSKDEGDRAFGAPGLRGVSGDGGEGRRAALAIAAAALLAGLLGARWERRQRGLTA